MIKIETQDAPKALGPYSLGIIVNGMIYTSGMLGINPSTNELEETIELQAEQAFKNVEAILKEGYSNLDNEVKTTVYLSNLANFGIVNGIYDKYFLSKPARSLCEVKILLKGALIEIEAIAQVK
jgi:2-iminobutanoate/2-iminopropanoate deaminase